MNSIETPDRNSPIKWAKCGQSVGPPNVCRLLGLSESPPPTKLLTRERNVRAEVRERQ